ncbi:MAG: TonB-dependent siderophore receptor [Luteolibacter sp.]
MKSTRCPAILSASIFTIATGMTSLHVYAQQAPTNLKEIIVTADSESGGTADLKTTQETAALKTSTPLLETPQSVSIIPEDQIILRNTKSTADALRYTAGVSTDTYGSDPRGYDWVNIRGFDSFNSQYLDGMRLYNYEQTEIFGLDHIEVLKGPSSVLFGQSTPGGLINNVSKKPKDQAFGELGAEVTDRGTLEATADLGDLLTKDGALAYRVVGLFREANQDSNGNDIDGRRYYIAPSVTWKIADDAKLTILTSFLRGESTQTPEFLPVGGDYLRVRYNNFDVEDNTIYRVGYAFEKKFGDNITLRQNARFSAYDVVDQYQYSGAYTSDTTLESYLADWRCSARTGTIDTQLEAKITNGPLEQTLLGGVDYGISSTKTTYREDPAEDFDLLNPDYYTSASADTLYSDSRQRLQQVGVYAQDQLKFASRWVAVGSLRHDWVYSRTREETDGSKEKSHDGAFTYRAGLMYLGDYGISPYTSYSTSFYPNSGTDADGNTFDPSAGKQFEVGVKYAPQGMRGGITFSAFDLKQDNVLTTDPVNSSYQKANGEWESKGVELEANVGVTKNIDLIGNITAMHVEIVKSEDGDEGNTPQLLPTHTAAGWITYTFHEGALDGLTFGGGLRYVGGTYQDNANTEKNDNYAVADAVARYTRGPWTYALNADNVFGDENYVGDGSGFYYQAAGRSFRLSVNYNW